MTKDNSILNGYCTILAALLGGAMGMLILRYERAALSLIALPFGVMAVRALTPALAKSLRLLKELSWWHALWFCMMLSGLVFRIRTSEAANTNPLDFLAVFRLGLVAVMGFVLLYRLMLRKPDWVHFLIKGLPGLLTAYTVTCLLSVMWSTYPLWTFYKSTEYLVDIALLAAVIASIHSIHDIKTFFDWTWLLLSSLIVTVWIGVLIWPDLAVLHDVGMLGFAIRGVFPAFETNGVGELSAILASVAITRIIFHPHHRALYFLVLLVALTTSILTQSRSPLLGLCVAAVLILFASRRVGLLVAIPVAVSAIFMLTSSLDQLGTFLLRGQRDEDFTSLSGRTNLWVLGWEMFKIRPFLGYGAYAGGRFTGIADTMAAGNSSILNTWLEIVLGVGLPTGLLMVAAFVMAWAILIKQVCTTTQDDVTHCLTVEALGVLAIISVRSMFTVHLIWHPPIAFFLVVGYAEYLRRTCTKSLHENTVSPQFLFAARR